MPGFESLPKALDEGQAYEPVVQADVKFSDEEMADLAALKMVVQDAEVAAKFANSKTLVQEWNSADDMYRDYVKQEYWGKDKTKPRSSLPIPVIMEAIETLLPQAFMAFFSDPQPFQLDPKGRTSKAAATAMAHALCWAIDQCGFEEEIRKCLKAAFLYGICIGKVGYKTIKITDKKYVRTDAGKGYKPKTYEISFPTFEWVDHRNVLVEPHTNCHDIRTAGYVIHQKYITAYDLDALRADGYKNVPTRAGLRKALVGDGEPTDNTFLSLQYITWRENQKQLMNEKGSVDPLKQPLELLEYRDGNRVITVLQRSFILRNELEQNSLQNTWRSCAFVDVLNAFYGFGVAKLLAGEQALQQAVLNKGVDALSLKVEPTFVRKSGVGVSSQNVHTGPGRVLNEAGELEPLKMESVAEEVLSAIQASEARASRRVGANFGPEMPTQAMRTAEGVQAFQSGVQVKLQYFIENFAKLVYNPTLEQFIELIKENMDEDELRAVLSDADAEALQADVYDIYNGKYAVDVLSSVKLAGRRSMSQLLIPIMQMLGQPAVIDSFNVQAKKFNFVNFFQDLFQIAGWPGDEYVEDMTNEDKQRLVQKEQIAAQSKQALLAQQQQNALDQIDRKGDVQGGVAVVKHTLDLHGSAVQHEMDVHGSVVQHGLDLQRDAAKPVATQPPQKKKK